MRLDKFISNNTQHTRSDVKKLIKAERVTLNNGPASGPQTHIDESQDVIRIDGRAIESPGKIYLMLHKPAGVVCANTDSQHPTVIDLIVSGERQSDPAVFIKHKLQIAGRLDIDTTGLVLVTNDGQWNHDVTSPTSKCFKRYRVRLAEPFDQSAIQAFAEGLTLDGEKKPTRPATIEPLSENELRLTISEGKYHQVKRMFAAVGNHVTALHRESIGEVELDPKLAAGEYRPLRSKEVVSLSRKTLRK